METWIEVTVAGQNTSRSDGSDGNSKVITIGITYQSLEYQKRQQALSTYKTILLDFLQLLTRHKQAMRNQLSSG